MSRHFTLPSALRWLLVVAGAGVAIWFVLAVTMALVLARSNPASAMALGYESSDAQATAAMMIIRGKTSAQDLARAEALAQGAVRRSAANARAFSTLGAVAALRSNGPAAQKHYAYSERLSRRDHLTQLWLLEAEVANNNIPGALVHYDRAMSTSFPVRGMLTPILLQASADPKIASALADRMARRPHWWREFADSLSLASPEPAVALPTIIPRLKLNMAAEAERRILSNSIDRLVKAGAYGTAFDLYKQAIPNAAPPTALRNGNFEQDGMLPPFDWQLTDNEGLSGAIEPLDTPEGGRALHVSAESRSEGVAARQLLILPAGQYRFGARVGGIAAADRPQIRVTCAIAKGAQGATLLTQPMPETPSGQAKVGGNFSVPQTDCGAQWVSIFVPGSLERRSQTPWVDDLVVRRVEGNPK